MNNGKHWTESFRIITPILTTCATILLTLVLFLLSNVNSTITGIDTKLFKHLTNDEIHCPKSMVVTKAEFSIYQQLRDRQMADIKEYIAEIRDAVSRKK